MTSITDTNKISKIKLVLSAVIPFFIIGGLIAYLLGPGSEVIDIGVSLPEISIEKIDFVEREIHVSVRNTGPIPTEIAFADVNDRIQPAAIEPHKHLERFETAVVRIPFSWNEGEPYEIGITTNDGTRFAKEVAAAAPALKPTLDFASYLALIGTYVGIIPVLVGLMWFPFLAKIRGAKYNFFLAFTAGLLIFLGVDAIEEAQEISEQNLAGLFNGTLLIVTVALVSFLGLFYSSQKLVEKSQSLNLSKPVAIALMVSIGIGLHNFGEGLAIGAAIGLGELALSTFLIIGFALHNTTEGIAIAAPMAKSKPMIIKLAALGMIAGAPAIFGGWVGGFFYVPFSAIIFLSIGAGAIFQVVVSIILWMKDDIKQSLGATIAGISVGMLVMYLTSVLV